MFALAVFSMSSFVACKDYDDGAYDDLKARLNDEITLREALKQQLDALQAYVGTIKSCTCDLEKALKDYLTKDEASKTYVTIENYNTAITLLNYAINDINNTLGDVDLSKGTVAEQLSVLNQLILNVQTLAERAMELAEANKVDITELKGAVEDLKGYYINLDSRLTEVEQKAADLLADYIALEARVKVNEGDIQDLYNKIKDYPDPSTYVTEDELKETKKELQDAIDAVEALGKEARQKAIDAYLKANDALDMANGHEIRIKQLENQVNTLINDVSTLKDEITAIKSRLDTVESDLKKLENKLKDVLKSMITGIIIQGTESPVIGYFNTPLDVRANVLAAYYGEVTSAVHFPSVNTGDYVDPDMFWPNPARNMEVMGINPADAEGALDLMDRFVSQKDGKIDGNAGTLYLTINPNTVNFEGVTLGMETSQESASPITLSPLAYSDRELTFGYTRGANNGFYEAQATMTVEKIDDAKMRIDYSALESAAKDVIKNKSKNSVLTFGATLLSSAKDVMPAYGVKASWTDALENNTHNVFSEYALATTAIKPLSYAFMKDFNAKLPGEKKIQELLGKIIDKLKIQLNLDLPDFSKWKSLINFKNINLDKWRNGEGKIVVDVQGLLVDPNTGNAVYVLTTNQEGSLEWVYLSSGDQEAYYYDENGTFHWAEYGLVIEFQTVEIDADADLTAILEDIANQIDEQYGEGSTLVDLLNAVVDLGDLNAKLNDAIVDVKDDIKSQLSGYITRAYNKLNAFFSKAPNKALQPILVAKSGNNVRLLSQAKSLATKVTGSSLTLYPTSYSLELLAPAYKKFVAVTDVWNASDGSEAAASIGVAANQGENMLKVIDSEKSCTLNGQAGYIYEITYTAVDYHGKVVARRFYVEF
jgi:predicted  nucleic acid-binding Zn-ribbon protein